MITRLPKAPLALGLLCLTLSSCAATTAGTAMPTAPPPTAETLSSLLLSAPEVDAALAGTEKGRRPETTTGVVVTREVSTPWNDSAHFDDTDCLAVAGAAQTGVYAGTGFTGMRGQVLREPPASGAWSHYAVQAVVLFPTAAAAGDFFARSQQSWAGCSDRELSYPQDSRAPQMAPDQVWSVGPAGTERGVLTVSRTESGPQQWSCQRALSVGGNVAVDVEACSLDGPTTAAAEIAGLIDDRLPSA
ncbi:MAG: sensor domain-containing protein [Mycobacterium sp.]